MSAHGSGLGGILFSGWSASEIADLLDGLLLTGHNPDHSVFPSPELYRPTSSDRPAARMLELAQDPYAVAAYLRYWAESRHDAPEFNLALPYGPLKAEAAPFSHPMLDMAISAGTHRLLAPWDRDGYVEGAMPFFDGPGRDFVDAAGQRMAGVPGLVVLYVVHKDAVGSGAGMPRKFHTPAIGISIPAGGPPFQVAANYEIDA
ncbi:MAG: hypothetical protein IIC95_04955 [Chloroflexi bacterium]|nr:hypothetical protein [Chloroflexota bacterium]